MVAVRWYIRYGLSYRDVEELLAERGIAVDQVTPVINRAMASLDQLRHTGPRPDPIEPPTEPDHLADIAEILRADRRLRTQVVLTRLADHDPDHYEGWTHADLKAALAGHGIEPVKSDGVMVVRADDITQALTHRHHNTSREGDDDPGS